MSLAGYFNPVDIEEALRATTPPPFPPVTDRAAWHQIRSRIGERHAATLVAAAEQEAGTSVPPLPATLYLDYRRTGQRDGYQEPFFRRVPLPGPVRDALVQVVTALQAGGGHGGAIPDQADHPASGRPARGEPPHVDQDVGRGQAPIRAAQ